MTVIVGDMPIKIQTLYAKFLSISLILLIIWSKRQYTLTKSKHNLYRSERLTYGVDTTAVKSLDSLFPSKYCKLILLISIFYIIIILYRSHMRRISYWLVCTCILLQKCTCSSFNWWPCFKLYILYICFTKYVQQISSRK